MTTIYPNDRVTAMYSWVMVGHVASKTTIVPMVQYNDCITKLISLFLILSMVIKIQLCWLAYSCKLANENIRWCYKIFPCGASHVKAHLQLHVYTPVLTQLNPALVQHWSQAALPSPCLKLLPPRDKLVFPQRLVLSSIG